MYEVIAQENHQAVNFERSMGEDKSFHEKSSPASQTCEIRIFLEDIVRRAQSE
jgi:hypothetical protein